VSDNPLHDLRQQLDQVDRQLIELAAERQRLVAEIGANKQQRGAPLRDFRREREVLAGVRHHASSLGLDADLAETLLKAMIEASLTSQEQARVRQRAHGEGQRALVIGGAGRIGAWLADFLTVQGFAVMVADPAVSDNTPHTWQDWRQAPLDCEVVVLATPPAATAAILDALAERQVPGLVIEVTSIKSPLKAALLRATQAGLKLCALHPMFGPSTRLLSGRHVLVMDTGNAEAVEHAKSLFADTMAEVVELDLDQHDRLMALVLGLSHALNIAFLSALVASGLQAEALATISSTTFKRQLEIAADVANENPALYHEIQHLNEHGEWARLALTQAVNQLSDASGQSDPTAFIELMRAGREYLQKLSPSG
jgi:chorismate mutase/prephenate dehydrogenase